MLKSIQDHTLTVFGVLSIPFYIWVMFQTVGQPWPEQLLMSALSTTTVVFIIVLLEDSEPPLHEVLFGLHVLFFLIGGPLLSGKMDLPFFVAGSLLSLPLSLALSTVIKKWEQRKNTKRMAVI